MSRLVVIEAVLLCLGLAALPVGARVLRPLGSEGLPLAVVPASVPETAPKSSHRSLDSLARAGADQAPFRAARRPASIAYDPDRKVGTGAAPRLSVPKPGLAVSGIVLGGGMEPTAIVDGLPGVEGARQLMPGDTVGGITVRRIHGGLVVLSGFDTVWTLGVKTPWR